MSIDSIDKTTDAPVVEEQTYQYPGTPTTCDGAEAVVWVETNICQGSGAYPITSSTTMGSGFNAARQNGVPNLWGDELVFVEPESEHSAATFCRWSRHELYFRPRVGSDERSALHHFG